MSTSPTPTPLPTFHSHIPAHFVSGHTVLGWISAILYVFVFLIAPNIRLGDYGNRSRSWLRMGTFISGFAVLMLFVGLAVLTSHQLVAAVISFAVALGGWRVSKFCYRRYAINFDYAGTQGFAAGIIRGRYGRRARVRQARIKRRYTGGG